MNPTMKMTMRASTSRMSSVIVYWCIMCNYVTIINENVSIHESVGMPLGYMFVYIVRY